MSAPDRLSSSVEALTDKELEILRLLMAGHTVKSIAARMGRSETSINERLRDARRKTGIGSSRELARHLDAQKIWDKKYRSFNAGFHDRRGGAVADPEAANVERNDHHAHHHGCRCRRDRLRRS